VKRLFGQVAGAVVADVAEVTERRDAVQRAPEDSGRDHVAMWEQALGAGIRTVEVRGSDYIGM
jgi:hypothetical protein